MTRCGQEIHPKETDMKEIQLGLISRRTAFSLIGVAVPATMLTVSGAVAQTPGMERREERREDRQGRREERRDDRQQLREDRRDTRQDRRDERRGIVDQPATTGTTGSA